MDAAVEAGRAAGLDCAGARIFRVRTATLVELPQASIIARVEPPSDLDVATRQVRVGQVFDRRQGPTARLCPGLAQPFVHPHGVVTLWERLVATDRPLAATALGRLVRALHDAGRPPLEASLPRLDPFTPTQTWQACPGPGFTLEELAALQALERRLRQRWEEVAAADPLGTRLVHGDLHGDNVVVTARGPRLVDLEMAGVGPASWDLAVPAVAVRRYGQPPAYYRDIAEGYGADPSGWEGFEVLCRTYELTVVAWCVFCCRESPQLAQEARLRVDSLLGSERRPWSLC